MSFKNLYIDAIVKTFSGNNIIHIDRDRKKKTGLSGYDTIFIFNNANLEYIPTDYIQKFALADMVLQVENTGYCIVKNRFPAHYFKLMLLGYSLKQIIEIENQMAEENKK